VDGHKEEGRTFGRPSFLLARRGFGTDARPGPEGGRGRLSGWDMTESAERSRRAASIPRLAPGMQLIGEYEGSGVRKPVFLVRWAPAKSYGCPDCSTWSPRRSTGGVNSSGRHHRGQPR
jgi:hypothetical protein